MHSENQPTAKSKFDEFVAQLRSDRIANASDLVGCSSAEIDALERKYAIKLPETYRVYLETMGHQSGLLFRSDHLAASYFYALNMTADLHEEWKNQQPAPPDTFVLPGNALIIAWRLAQQFEFIVCTGEEDAAVYYFNDWEWQVRKTNASFHF